MFTKVNYFQDYFNRVFLFLNLKRNIKESVIDEKVKECIEELELINVTPKIERNIKVRLLKEYFSLPKGQLREVTATINIQRKLAIELIPKTNFVAKEDSHFSEKRDFFLKGLDRNSNENNKISRYLSNERIKKLAQKIDLDMEKNLDFQSFAHLIALSYKKELQQIIISTTNDAAGAEDLADACLAVTLLQKNNKFKDALEQLKSFAIQSNGLFEFIKAACMNYEAGILAIDSK